MPALEPLISRFRRSRALVAPVYFELASRPLVGNHTLRGSVLFEPRLGPLEVLPYLVRDRAI
jgi:hypothetical protein